MVPLWWQRTQRILQELYVRQEMTPPGAACDYSCRGEPDEKQHGDYLQKNSIQQFVSVS